MQEPTREEILNEINDMVENVTKLLEHVTDEGNNKRLKDVLSTLLVVRENFDDLPESEILKTLTKACDKFENRGIEIEVL